mmetsp:Transcript_17735/g.37065  ORF Transcript_17735/g.37065 Transcript_17735/m.37065 type:complete len:378 (-) Transcript_17735:443-1576(-)
MDNIDLNDDVGIENDDNEKHSKFSRQSKGFLRQGLVFVGALTVFCLVLGHMHTKNPPQLSKDIHHLMKQHNLQPSHSKNMPQSKDDDDDDKIDKDDDDDKIDKDNDNDNDNEAPPQLIPIQEQQQNELELAASVEALDQKVRARKATRGILMETDPKGLELTKALQAETLKLLERRYGYGTKRETFRVRVDLIYPNSVLKDERERESPSASFVIEMAPPSLLPCSVFYFMEIARTYKGGEFHRNARHVLQAAAQSGATKGHRSMPFQEYSPEHPHAQYTTGYAGRPSGPGWYVSIQDNSANHGPGSQQKANPYEADSNFGRIVQGVDEGVIAKIHSVPQKEWLSKENCVKITQLTILVPAGDDDGDESEWIEWQPQS